MSVLQTNILQAVAQAVRDNTRRLSNGDRRQRWAVKLTILAAMCAIAMLEWLYSPGRTAVAILWYSPVARFMFLFGAAYGAVSTVWCVWRLYLAIRYRPFPLVDVEKLPSITVIVPAFNEGALVGDTLRCLAKAEYPEGKLQIIAVDDGSTDDTWSHIESTARELGDIVTPIRCAVNRGKRWALWEGFRRAKGEVFVTVDSDSLIDADALRALVSPMVSNPNIGAVAGNVRVLDPRSGLIPQMMAVRYVMTFDYKRAAQSMMGGGAVLCCAGALAAYRRSAVEPVLDKWLHQRFRGGPARAGEDHAMTNFIISQGHKVCYQRTAHVRTKTPTTYLGLCKMFLRWARSNIRESVHTASYVFTSFRKESKIGIRFNFVMAAVGLALPYPFLICSLALSFCLPMIFGLKLLAACVYGSMMTMVFYAIRERNTDALFGAPYGFYSTFLLWWIWPYALLTCHKSVWMTRTAHHGEAAPAKPHVVALGTANLEAMPDVASYSPSGRILGIETAAA